MCLQRNADYCTLVNCPVHVALLMCFSSGYVFFSADCVKSEPDQEPAFFRSALVRYV